MKTFTLLLLFLPLLFQAQTVTTIATNTGINDGLTLDGLGHLFGSRYGGGKVYKIDLSDNSVTTHAEGLVSPNGSTLGPDGNLYVADDQGGKIYQITPDGTATVYKETPCTGVIFLPGTDTLLVCSYFQSTVRKIAPDGTEIPFAAAGQLNGPVNFCIDDEGQVYVANYTDRKIIKLLPDGTQELLVQGPSSGNLGFVAYTGGYIYGTLISTDKIFRTDLDGNAEIFLGSTAGTADGGPGEAKFSGPNGIVASANGDTLYISDFETRNIRMITNLEGEPSSSADVFKNSVLEIVPNPFSNFAQFSFELAVPANVSAELRDASGKLIFSIFENKKLEAGNHQFAINGNGLTPGIYYMVLKNGQKITLTKKLVRK